MRRVRHQHDVRTPLSGRDLPQLSEGIIRKHVTIDEQERRIAEMRQGLNNAARSFKRGLLHRDRDRDLPLTAIPQKIDQLLTKVGGIDHNLSKARCRKSGNVVLDCEYDTE